ncbi:MAG TPA: LPS export ABC transporter periplasmic protein LptC [Burkholderiales bacterium]|nr:LPS export ABC transporter periplasmic protein LptC [Burkholderiales bacterium]
MKTRAAHLLPLVLMLLLAAMTLWLQYAVQEGAGGEGGARRHDPDAIIENFTVNRMDASGKPRYTFSAPKMLHYPDDDLAEVLYPRFVSQVDGGGNLVASASRGTVNGEGEKASLYGNVVIVREATPERGELSARTEFLQMLLEEGIARTDRSVTLTEGRSVVTGVGMTVDNDKQQFALRSRVRVIYDAPKRK